MVRVSIFLWIQRDGYFLQTFGLFKRCYGIEYKVLEHVVNINKMGTVAFKLYFDLELENVFFMKMDVEGSEYNALMGAKCLFSNYLVQTVYSTTSSTFVFDNSIG